MGAETLADQVILFRMGERLVLTGIILLVALVVMIGFWKSVQKMQLTEGGALGIAGSFTFSTPVFVLLAIVGYTHVTLSHPITVASPAGAPVTDVADAGGGETRFIGMGGAAPAGPDPAFNRSEAINRVRSLNCVAGDQALSARSLDDLVEVKLALLQPHWSDDWGDFGAFAAWATGRATAAPDPEAAAVFAAEHVVC